LELNHVILIYTLLVLNEGIHKSISKLTNVYYEGASIYENKSYKKLKIHMDIIKILVMVILQV